MSNENTQNPPTFAAEVVAAQAQVKAAGIAVANVLTQPLDEARAKSQVYQQFLNAPVPDVAEVREFVLDHLEHPLRVRLYYPTPPAAGQSLSAYLHVHGGGFAQGDLNSLDRLKREIANSAGIVTVGLEYTLSPEARYPVAIEQTVGVLQWLRDNAETLHIDPTRIAVGGDSAGGNLALNALIRLRDANDAFVRTGVIFYGMLSTDHDSASHVQLGSGKFGLSTERLAWFWSQYKGDTIQARHPEVEPLYADLRDLPPLMLLAAGLDPLLDDTLNLAARLNEAGQVTVPKVYPGVPHAFIAMTRLLPQAQEARDHVIAHLLQHLA